MAKQVVVDLKANTGDVQRGMDKLADAIADLNQALGGFNKEAENLDDVADSAKKAESGFKKFSKFRRCFSSVEFLQKFPQMSMISL